MKQEIYDRALEMVGNMPFCDGFNPKDTWEDLNPNMPYSDTCEAINALAEEFNISWELAYKYMKKAYKDYDYANDEDYNEINESQKMSIEQHVNAILNSVGLIMYQDKEGTYEIGLSDYDGDSIVAFSKEMYKDFKSWYPSDEIKVVMATPEQMEAYRSIEDELDFFSENGYWRDDPEWQEEENNDIYESKNYKNMKKNVKQINESQLRAIVAESVKKVLNEEYDGHSIAKDIYEMTLNALRVFERIRWETNANRNLWDDMEGYIDEYRTAITALENLMEAVRHDAGMMPRNATNYGYSEGWYRDDD